MWHKILQELMLISAHKGDDGRHDSLRNGKLRRKIIKTMSISHEPHIPRLWSININQSNIRNNNNDKKRPLDKRNRAKSNVIIIRKLKMMQTIILLLFMVISISNCFISTIKSSQVGRNGGEEDWSGQSYREHNSHPSDKIQALIANSRKIQIPKKNTNNNTTTEANKTENHSHSKSNERDVVDGKSNQDSSAWLNLEGLNDNMSESVTTTTTSLPLQTSRVERDSSNIPDDVEFIPVESIDSNVNPTLALQHEDGKQIALAQENNGKQQARVMATRSAKSPKRKLTSTHGKTRLNETHMEMKLPDENPRQESLRRSGANRRNNINNTQQYSESYVTNNPNLIPSDEVGTVEAPNTLNVNYIDNPGGDNIKSIGLQNQEASSEEAENLVYESPYSSLGNNTNIYNDIPVSKSQLPDDSGQYVRSRRKSQHVSSGSDSTQHESQSSLNAENSPDYNSMNLDNNNNYQANHNNLQGYNTNNTNNQHEDELDGIGKIIDLLDKNNKSIEATAKQLNFEQVELLNRMADNKHDTQHSQFIPTRTNSRIGLKSAKIMNALDEMSLPMPDRLANSASGPPYAPDLQQIPIKRQQQQPSIESLQEKIREQSQAFYNQQQQRQNQRQQLQNHDYSDLPQEPMNSSNQRQQNLRHTLPFRQTSSQNDPFFQSNLQQQYPFLSTITPTATNKLANLEDYYASKSKQPLINYEPNFVQDFSTTQHKNQRLVDSIIQMKLQKQPHNQLLATTPLVGRKLRPSASQQHAAYISNSASASPHTKRSIMTSNNNNIVHFPTLDNNNADSSPYVMFPENQLHSGSNPLFSESSAGTNSHKDKQDRDNHQQYFGYLRALPQAFGLGGTENKSANTSINGNKSNYNHKKASNTNSKQQFPTEASQTHTAYHLAPSFGYQPYGSTQTNAGFSPARSQYASLRYPSHIVRPILAGLQHRVGFGGTSLYSSSASAGSPASSSDSDPNASGGSSSNSNNIHSAPSSSISNTDPMWSDSRSQSQDQDDYLQSPQTIQITAVPSALNGWNGGLNGFNGFNGWNGGFGGPFNGRQVLLVNRQPGVANEWRQWLLPVAIVLALPLVLGALFVPVLLKSVMFLIQILQMLGLLLPPGQMGGHLAATAHNASSG